MNMQMSPASTHSLTQRSTGWRSHGEASAGGDPANLGGFECSLCSRQVDHLTLSSKSFGRDGTGTRWSEELKQTSDMQELGVMPDKAFEVSLWKCSCTGA